MIFTKDFFNLISDFGEEWVITKIEADHIKKVSIIRLEYKGEKYFDPRTEDECTLYDHAPEREWRHLDIWDYKTYVRCRLPRVKCKDGKVRTIRYGWADHHDRHTYSFEIKVIETLRATKNQSKTAELLGCSFRLVNRIIHQCTERGLERRDLQKAPIAHISIDEKSFKKGHQYVTVISHPGSGCVLDVGEGRDTNSVIRMLYKTFSINQLSNVLTVSMDMWKAYIKAIKKILPKAEIIHDKFHLIKYLNEAIDKVRKREVKENEILKGSRYALLKNEENRTEKQREVFQTILQTNLEVSKTHHAKEAFKSLFDMHNDDKLAKQNLIDWATYFFKYKIKELNAIILRMLSHTKGVINAMISKFNNAMAERLNGKIQEIKLSAKGYRNFDNFRSAILFFHGNLNLYPLKW